MRWHIILDRPTEGRLWHVHTNGKYGVCGFTLEMGFLHGGSVPVLCLYCLGEHGLFDTKFLKQMALPMPFPIDITITLRDDNGMGELTVTAEPLRVTSPWLGEEPEP